MLAVALQFLVDEFTASAEWTLVRRGAVGRDCFHGMDSTQKRPAWSALGAPYSTMSGFRIGVTRRNI